MSEINFNEVVMAGRITQGPIEQEGRVHFLLKASDNQEPFHAICEGKTAEHLVSYCQVGDEVSVEGELWWVNFNDIGRTLVIYARHISYGRKTQPIS